MLSTLLATCVIVFPVDHDYKVEIRNHEYAHCNGWVHPEDKKPFTGATGNHRYRYYQPPADLVRKAYPGVVVYHALTLKEVKFICGETHVGCQWFED